MSRITSPISVKVCAVACAVIGASLPAEAEGQFWVVGTRNAQSCDIVTSNPVLGLIDGNMFASGPYRSRDDAKLSRSTIAACPKVEEPAAPSK